MSASSWQLAQCRNAIVWEVFCCVSVEITFCVGVKCYVVVNSLEFHNESTVCVDLIKLLY